MLDEKGNITGAGKVAIIEGLTLLQQAIRRNNFEKGWRAETPVGETKRVVSEHVALLHSEVTEIYESYRNNEPELWYEHKVKTNGVERVSGPDDGFADQPVLYPVDGTGAAILGKPQGMVSELADVIIRCLDFADEHGFELIETLLEKHDYNLTRPYRHGGKAA